MQMMQNHSGSRGSNWRRHHPESLSPHWQWPFRLSRYPTPPLACGRGGIHELLDIETAQATGDTLTTVHADPPTETRYGRSTLWRTVACAINWPIGQRWFARSRHRRLSASSGQV